MVLDDGRSEPLTAPTVVGALDDEQCRDLLSELSEPTSVSDLAERADVPLSTTYRKVARLKRAELVDERTEIREGGHHRTRYVRDFERIVLEMDEADRLDVAINRPLAEPEQNLVDMWTEVRDAT
ncbi:winged helix-turn-helix transcriptional regulator [Natronomonas salina]|uniref:winged helix-turn-helix domain-containing protein n=1 Tax=Natronomonas salina TaxID=1710540 RepID=UPI0015B75786|nr:winged helix-turn-helix domain-containing protein [Natronomonas salina]QLD88266.1 winged helix-turn-helix transcriptional regulator [Natronomonas salina]